MEAEQLKAKESREILKQLREAEEERVATLESKLAELSEVVGSYDRVKQQDLQAIQYVGFNNNNSNNSGFLYSAQVRNSQTLTQHFIIIILVTRPFYFIPFKPISAPLELFNLCCQINRSLS